MSIVIFCSMLRTGRFFKKFTFKSNIFVSYFIVSRNDQKLVMFSVFGLGRESFNSRPYIGQHSISNGKRVHHIIYMHMCLL